MRCNIRLSLNFPREASARYVFQFFAEMLDFIESDEESENFEGFNDDDVNGYESESDISISSVGSENISDVENLFSKDETEESWSSNSRPLNVQSFTWYSR